MESLEEKTKKFLSVNSENPYSDGAGNGEGFGSDLGSGFGCGCGSGCGYECRDGSGCGIGSGYGYKYCNGFGSGSGDSRGDGYDNACGNGSGINKDIKSYNGYKLYFIDNIHTLIYSIFGNYANGAVLSNDLTLQHCYIAKVGNFFAHGYTLKDARRDAELKWQQNWPIKTRINKFVQTHPNLDTLYDDLFVWHSILTGSCEMGRKKWCKAHGYKPTDSITVREFINGTVNDYGGKIIRKLAKRYHLRTL